MCFQRAIGSFGPRCFGQPSCRKKEEPNQAMQPRRTGQANRQSGRQRRAACFIYSGWLSSLALGHLNDYRSDDTTIKENTYEIHAHLVRTSARIAYGILQCTEADSGGFRSMEGARQFQDRVV